MVYLRYCKLFIVGGVEVVVRYEVEEVDYYCIVWVLFKYEVRGLNFVLENLLKVFEERE